MGNWLFYLDINNNGQIVGASHVKYLEGHPLTDPDNPEHRNFEHAFFAEKSGDSWVMKDIHPEIIYRYPEADGTDRGLNDSSATDINDAAQTIITRSSSSIEFDITVAYRNDIDWSFVTIEEAFSETRYASVATDPVINNSGEIGVSYVDDDAHVPAGTSVSYSDGSWHRTKLNPTSVEGLMLFIEGINDSNQMTGRIIGGGVIPPFIATKENNEWIVTALDNIRGVGNGINDSGVVVGMRNSHNTIDGSIDIEAFIYI